MNLATSCFFLENSSSRKEIFSSGKDLRSIPSRKKTKTCNFCLVPKLEKKISGKYFISKIFFFFWRNIFLKFSLQILEPAKNFMFSFFLCWVFTECFWEDAETVVFFISTKVCREKSLFKSSFPWEMNSVP